MGRPRPRGGGPQWGWPVAKGMSLYMARRWIATTRCRLSAATWISTNEGVEKGTITGLKPALIPNSEGQSGS